MFTKQQWTCDGCTFLQDASNDKCEICSRPNPFKIKPAPSIIQSTYQPSSFNSNIATIPSIVNKPKQLYPKPKTTPWKCVICNYETNTGDCCDMCDEKHPKLAFYEKLFNFYDTENTGKLLGNQMFSLFLSSNISKSVLGDIWDEITKKKSGGIDLKQFIYSMKLISLAQSGNNKPLIMHLEQNEPISIPKMKYPTQIQPPSISSISSTISIQKSFNKLNIQPGAASNDIDLLSFMDDNPNDDQNHNIHTNINPIIAPVVPIYNDINDYDDDDYDDVDNDIEDEKQIELPTVHNFPGTPAVSVPSTNIFKVYAALDFGTDGTGLAYCLPSNDEVYIHDKWKSWKRNRSKNKTNKVDMSSVKPRTAILLDKTGKFKAFGDNALRIYMNMKDNKSLLFEHFKMNLYSKDDNNNNATYVQNLVAVNGQSYPSSEVFIAALRYLKEQAIHVFKRNKLKIKSNKDICWIVTVPAIWSDESKKLMREWAFLAGMIDLGIPNHLILQYEPNCAALSVLHEMKDQNKIIINSKCILIDAGGGTVDIACNQILDGYNIRQILPASGGPWGDMYIDNHFINILNKIFNKEWINEFKLEEPNCYLSLIDNFRRSKFTFKDNDDFCEWNDDDGKQWHNVNIPFEFIEFMEDKLDDIINDLDLETIVNNFALNKWVNCFELNGESLKIHNNIWKYELFDKMINPTIDHCKKLLSHKAMLGTKYLCIVGGFGSIKYFQDKLALKFGKNTHWNLDFIIPERPILSVLDGAARMAKKIGGL